MVSGFARIAMERLAMNWQRFMKNPNVLAPVLWFFGAFLLGIVPHIFFQSTWDSLGYVQAYQAVVDGSWRIPLADTSWHVFSVHFWPLGLLLTPLFLLFPGYWILVLCQSAWLAASIPALRRLLELRPISDKLRSTLMIAWMCHPFLLGMHTESREGFQLLTMCIPLFFWGQWAWESGKSRVFFAIGVALLLVREDVALTVAAWSVFLLIKDRKRKEVWALLAISLAWFPFVLSVVVRHFNGGAYQVGAWGYEWAGNTPAEIVTHLVGHPFSSLAHMSTPTRFAAIAAWIGGSLGGAILAPIWLIPALPQLGVVLLSDFPNIPLPIYRYSAPILPFMWLAAVEVVSRYPARLGWAAKLLPWSLAILLPGLLSVWVRDVHMNTSSVMSCLERELPNGTDLTVTNYRGITRLWGQDRTITTMDTETAKDPRIPLKPWILIDHSRKKIGLFPPEEIPALEARLRTTPTHRLHWEQAGFSLWGPIDAVPPCGK